MPDGAPILVKEVQTPQRYDSGLGVLVVASAAVFAALLGSSMVLRARTSCALHRPVVAPSVAPVAPSVQPPPAVEPTACGEPVFHHASDGTLRLVYTVCPAQRESLAEIPPEATATPLPLDLRFR